MNLPSEDWTRDELFDGALSLWQRKKGYRFGLDSLLLATDLPPLPPDAQVVELGAGQGAVALTIAHQHPRWEVIALERQESLLELLHQNVIDNQLSHVEILAGDLRDHRQLFEAHSADLVVANPPYFPQGARRPSSDSERAAARHELFGGIEDFIRAAAYILNQRGWLQMIAPPLRLRDALQAADETDLALASLRFYHSHRDTPAYLVELRWRRGGAADPQIRPPLFIYDDDPGELGASKHYSPEVAARLQREGR